MSNRTPFDSFSNFILTGQTIMGKFHLHLHSQSYMYKKIILSVIWLWILHPLGSLVIIVI